MPARHFLTLKTAVSFGLVWPVTLHTKGAHDRLGTSWTLSPPTPSGSMLPRVVLPGDLFSWALEAEMVSLRRVQVCSESW